MNKQDAKIVIDCVCDRLELPVKELLTKRKGGRVSQARTLCAYALKELSGDPSKAVAAHLKSEKSTVDKALKRLEKKCAEDAKVKRERDRILKHARSTLKAARDIRAKRKARSEIASKPG